MKENEYLKRFCPVCGTEPPETTTVSTPKNAEGLDLEAVTQSWNGFFKEKVIFSYVRCGNCSLLYCPTFFTNSQLEILYEQMPPNMDEVPMAALIDTQHGYFKFLKNSTPLSGGYVEIGPDIGLFTEHCVREGSFTEYWLFEPNHAVTPALEKVVKDHKAHVIQEMTDFTTIPDGAISAAVIIHVMDHLLDPVATLSALKKKLTSQARVLIVTHDESSLLRRLFSWRWPAFCLQHPQIYSPQTTKALFKAAGFDVIEQHKTVNYFRLSFLVKHGLWALGIRVKTVPRFGNITIGLKLGNILTIAEPSEELV
jgi:hypothetical protein